MEKTPVPNNKGGYYNHLQEMKQSLVALRKSVKTLEGSLQNPFLAVPEKKIISDALDSAYKYIKDIESLFNEYGYGGQ